MQIRTFVRLTLAVALFAAGELRAQEKPSTTPPTDNVEKPATHKSKVPS